MPEDPIAGAPQDPTPEQRRDWTTPRLERLDVDGTEMGVTAKNPSTFEGSTSYKSPAVCD